ncbi:MAG: hypothetical protein AYP45_14940 [Candidatus Brocadia carolinensis]|uniref:Uncharacterized protein n=1 Tax=Candidatus Brocadia carolinensis TaxID=1004156 RepID=A0A1V4AQH2_9BACT|nr:MAG: hypothetical protein AYP45_14940 [Candidatus Brocadia caroliniensis]
MVAAQIASANEIISSQERIEEGIDKVAYGIGMVAEGMSGLKAAFEWGISEVVWQIEQNKAVLKDILGVLIAPLDTQAKELRRRAEDAYANGWFKEALEDFLESEKKNKYDFLVHISIGMIYLFQKIDKGNALEYFDKAIKYGTPKSKYYTSFALLHKALIKRDFGLMEEAEACARQAGELSPNFSEAFYHCAQYNALLNRPDKAMQMLTKAIMLDANYCNKANVDLAFSQFQSQLTGVFEDFRNTEGSKARNKLAMVTKRIEKLNGLLDESKGFCRIEDMELSKCLARITELMKRNSYRDYLEANTIIEKLSTVIDDLCSNIIKQLKQEVQLHESEIYKIKNNRNLEVNNVDDKFKWIMWLGIVISVFLGLRGCWVLGTGTVGTGKEGPLLGALWALIWMAGCGIAITAGLYKLVTFLTKSSTKNEAASQINQVRSIADHLYDLIKRLKKYNDEDNGNTGLDKNNNYSTHSNNYSPSKNESSSGKKISMGYINIRY